MNPYALVWLRIEIPSCKWMLLVSPPRPPFWASSLILQLLCLLAARNSQVLLSLKSCCRLVEATSPERLFPTPRQQVEYKELDLYLKMAPVLWYNFCSRVPHQIRLKLVCLKPYLAQLLPLPYLAFFTPSSKSASSINSMHPNPFSGSASREPGLRQLLRLLPG